jgi:hypothetical protein
MIATAAVISLLLGACGSDDEEANTAPTASANAGSDLQGSWVTDSVSPDDVEAALREHGLGKWIRQFRPLSPIQEPTTLLLELRNGEWDLYGKSSGQPRVEIDFDAEFETKGDSVEKVHSTGTTTYSWSISGDTLTLDWQKTTEPPVEGIPDEVFQRALYSEEFEREG